MTRGPLTYVFSDVPRFRRTCAEDTVSLWHRLIFYASICCVEESDNKQRGSFCYCEKDPSRLPTPEWQHAPPPRDVTGRFPGSLRESEAAGRGERGRAAGAGRGSSGQTSPGAAACCGRAATRFRDFMICYFGCLLIIRHNNHSSDKLRIPGLFTGSRSTADSVLLEETKLRTNPGQEYLCETFEDKFSCVADVMLHLVSSTFVLRVIPEDVTHSYGDEYYYECLQRAPNTVDIELGKPSYMYNEVGINKKKGKKSYFYNKVEIE
ncbi:hypothetical protein F2P81_024610 [Scophthalmus maximus]|uniref:Uncharacterized protein n=1 Tax=Scophthalmus maximus TaxID=52904 RepID=A0A6A4RXD4_SCOMX|nr:hypothetical protein F2P81_024610 [Scophthalmus maximus]